MSPKFVDKEKKAKDIVHAALNEFSQKGYAATSMEQIAVAAGIAKGTVYEYFPSKDKLYIAALMVFVEEFESALSERLATIDPPLERLVAFIGFFIEACNPENLSSIKTQFDVLQQSLLENGVLFNRKYLVREMISGSRKILTDILLDGVSKGVFQLTIARDAEKMAKNIIAFLDGASLHSLITENYFDMQQQLTHGIKILTSFLLVTPHEYDVDELIAEAAGR